MNKTILKLAEKEFKNKIFIEGNLLTIYSMRIVLSNIRWYKKFSDGIIIDGANIKNDSFSEIDFSVSDYVDSLLNNYFCKND